MAEIFPAEGLDYILSIIPKGAAAPSNLYVGLIGGGSASTVPTSAAVLSTGTTMSTFYEPASGTYLGYSRKTLAAANWTAQSDTTTGGAGRKTTFNGTLPSWTAGAGGWATAVNGFFIATNAVISGGTVLYYSNFDDGVGVTLQNTDQLTVTPYIGFLL